MKDRTCRDGPTNMKTTTTKPTGEVRHDVFILEEKESPCDDLLKKIFCNVNMHLAWRQVRKNNGAAGVDGMEVSDFGDFAFTNWNSIYSKLMEGTYRPSPVRRVEIKKDDGGKRPLGIPTVLDRVIQQAIAQQLRNLWEPTFSEHSHGFRPGRSAHHAVTGVVKASKKERKFWAVDCDLKSFFDTVDHDVLMSKLRAKISDERVLKLIWLYLKAGVLLQTDKYEETPEGVPQGGPLSPLLANILLDDLDRELEKRGHTFARYADDFIILCRSRRAAQRVLENTTKYIEKRLKLIVNQTKSKICLLRESSFLGFTFRTGKLRWTEKSQQRFKANIRKLTRRNRGVSPSKVMYDLANYIRGAVNYYGIGLQVQEAEALDRWIRRRVRLYYWKQWKGHAHAGEIY
ncbi:MAG: group II intron reverse transcriptase/maturase [Verrucomicrobiales bacterium]|nr:group II intron reverse transcriptase/maturase [Verrucomicrobiales bacterium]